MHFSRSVLLVLDGFWVFLGRVEGFLEAVSHAAAHEEVGDNGGALGRLQAAGGDIKE